MFHPIFSIPIPLFDFSCITAGALATLRVNLGVPEAVTLTEIK